MITKVKVCNIFPNPFQPKGRLNIAEATAKEFADSILQHGLILTPVGRQTPGNCETYQLADGWLRLAGYKYLSEHAHPEFVEMPLDIREFTDQQMADTILEANKVHKDLTPIDKANFYAEYLDKFHVTQAELARKHNLTQGEIANTIRLLQLPQDIQDKIGSHEISETHARILVALKDWPGLLQELVKKVSAEGMTTAALEAEVRQILGRHKKSRKSEPPPVPVKAQVQTEVQTQELTEEKAKDLPLLTEQKKPVESGIKTTKPEHKPKESKAAAPAVTPAPPKWKRKLALEETENGVRCSLMSEKGFIVKNLIGNLETTLERLPEILAEANMQWEAK